MARFAPGDDVVLFLEPASDEPAVYVVRGLSAGKVQLTQVQGQPQAVRDLEGLALMRTGRIQVRPMVPAPSLGTPEAFLARVRLAVKGVAQ